MAPEASCLEAVSQFTASQQLLVEGEGEGSEVTISLETRRWQLRMAKLQQRQRERGGVIDVHAKDEVIDETWVCMRAASFWVG